MNEEKNKIRVLIVDDSFFMRKLLREILDSDSEIEVIGEAKNGAEAIGEASRLKPDVITMDYKMPKLNGAQATEKILEGPEPLPVIIMLSAYARKEAKETLKILRAGAVDFILKPSGELSLDIDKIKEEIIRKIKIASRAKIQRHKPLRIKEKKSIKERKSAIKVVIIGASTGGPPVLENIISKLPSSLAAAVLVIQHMPAHFTKIFAERLSEISEIPVKEAEENDIIKIGQVIVARGGFQMKIKEENDGKISKKMIYLTKEPGKYGLCPSIDVSMLSASRVYFNQIVGVILTGMGEDGLEGIKAIKAVHGYVIVQEPVTAVIDSMPKAIIKNGLADEILPPDKIAQRIVELST